MSINSILKKEGITVVRKLNTLEINRIAKNISEKIINNFSEYLLNYDDLFSAFSRIDMYLAKMPADSSCAKYFYMNNSIYFNDENKLDVSGDSIFALHECLHFIQTCRNQHGKVYRLGLYEIGKQGIAINEAAVQYMASVAQNSGIYSEKYYDIDIKTISPDYYPLQCALLEEMLYFTGIYPLYQSTLNSNDIFKNTFISCSNKSTYDTIENNLEKMLKLEDDLCCFSMEMANTSKEKDFKLLSRLIENRKTAIKNVFFDTQNAIIQNCFTTAYNNINTVNDIKEYQDKLYKFKDVLCYTDDYTYYNDFYCDAMSSLDSIRDYIKSGHSMNEYRTANTSLVVKEEKSGIVDKFKNIVQSIRKLFKLNRNTQISLYKNK